MSEPVYTLFVGIDIAMESASVAFLEAADKAETIFDIKQTQKSVEQLIKRLRATKHPPDQTLVVIEATGNYWWQISLALHEAKYCVSVINPARAHYFARALLKRAKTDHIDALTLAQLAEALKPKLWTPPPEVHSKLHQRLAEREDLAKNRTQVLNRLHALRHHPRAEEAVTRRQQELADFLQRQIAEIDKEIGSILAENDEWNQAAKRLLSIKGIGVLSAAWLLVVTNNFTSCESADQLISYAGLAPRVRESGSSLNKRRYIGHAGSNQLRKTFYMAALNATQFNPIIKRFYDRLRERGKPFKVANCACSRKLLTICWAVATKKTEFDPEYQQTDLVPAIA
jgi:transposase